MYCSQHLRRTCNITLLVICTEQQGSIMNFCCLLNWLRPICRVVALCKTVEQRTLSIGYIGRAQWMAKFYGPACCKSHLQSEVRQCSLQQAAYAWLQLKRDLNTSKCFQRFWWQEMLGKYVMVTLNQQNSILHLVPSLSLDRLDEVHQKNLCLSLYQLSHSTHWNLLALCMYMYSNTLFRMGAAAVLLSNKSSWGSRAKYALQVRWNDAQQWASSFSMQD